MTHVYYSELAGSVDGIDNLSSIIFVVAMSSSLIVAGSVDVVEDLSSIPDEDDACPVVYCGRLC
jgi:hypothetical protein